MNNQAAKKTRMVPEDVRLFLVVSLAIAIPVIAVQVCLYLAGSEQLGMFVDSASIIVPAIGVAILLMLIPRVWNRTFRITAALITTGFLFLVIANIIWFYYTNILGTTVPDVSLADVFYLGCYVLWIAATLPYIRSYHGMMKRGSGLVLLGYSVIAAVIVWVVGSYWYQYSIDYGYDGFVIAVWLSYTVVPTICLFFLLAVTLLYSKGLMKHYWLFFLLPIILNAAADIVGGVVYVIASQTGTDLFRLQDLLYLAAYAFVVGAGFAILRAQLGSLSIKPVTEKVVSGGQPIEMEAGRSYMISERNDAAPVEAAVRMIKEGKSVLVVSSLHPTLLRESYGIKTAPMLWLSDIDWFSPDPMEKNVPLSKLNLLGNTIDGFLRYDNSVVVLLFPESIAEEMIPWDEMKKMITAAAASAESSKKNLVIGVNPALATTQQVAFLESVTAKLRIAGFPQRA